jgi:predicted transcriptional regulator
MNDTDYAIIPMSVTLDRSLSDTAFRLYAEIVSLLTQRAEPLTISQETLAADLGWSHSTVKRALAELRTSGLVTSKRTGRESVYVVHERGRA